MGLGARPYVKGGGNTAISRRDKGGPGIDNNNLYKEPNVGSSSEKAWEVDQLLRSNHLLDWLQTWEAASPNSTGGLKYRNTSPVSMSK